MQLQNLARDLQISSKTAWRYLASAAQCCHDGQVANLERVVDYIASLPQSLRPVALIMQHKFDETQFHLRISLSEEELETAEGQRALNKSLGKTCCFWRAGSLRHSRPPTQQQAKLLHGSFKAHQALLIRLTSCFPHVLRISESDEGPANIRAERLLAGYWGKAAFHSTLHWFLLSA